MQISINETDNRGKKGDERKNTRKDVDVNTVTLLILATWHSSSRIVVAPYSKQF